MNPSKTKAENIIYQKTVSCSASVAQATKWSRGHLFATKLMFACFLVPVVASANSYTLYGLDVNTAQVVIINPTNGVTTHFADLPFTPVGYPSFDYRPNDGKLYINVVQSNNHVFYSIDTTTGAVSETSKVLTGFTFSSPGPGGIGFNSSGDFYGYGERAGFSQGDFMFVEWDSLQTSIRPQK